MKRLAVLVALALAGAACTSSAIAPTTTHPVTTTPTPAVLIPPARLPTPPVVLPPPLPPQLAQHQSPVRVTVRVRTKRGVKIEHLVCGLFVTPQPPAAYNVGSQTHEPPPGSGIARSSGQVRRRSEPSGYRCVRTP